MSEAMAFAPASPAPFVAGFAARHEQSAASTLAAAFAAAPGFAPVDVRERVQGPRHFSPANPDCNPTEGWDPLDPAAQMAAEIDPIEVAHAAGFAEGLAAAQAAAAEAAARDQQLVSELLEALKFGGGFDREAMAGRLRQTVMFLVSRLVGETGVAADLLATRVDAAAGLLADKAEAALLRLNPDDVALLDGKLPATIFAAGDANVARGSFVLESASTIVEDGPELWLEQLAAAIERVPTPK
ncbi:flagellar assembly protein FliH [Sphingomonas jinjuensis]|uniref:Flagellar assembly protein FliH n=1 Tax=Sphingomonas jinjuensis TaxID=535907 RepID=A0A840F962_9SPHN|nr:flagellar biosynthesis protein FliH [Sphingomonas jinjuensis]MBB4152334.1 flagellar assembly protein FliH [Sphingomonas jinjuensis]